MAGNAVSFLADDQVEDAAESSADPESDSGAPSLSMSGTEMVQTMKGLVGQPSTAFSNNSLHKQLWSADMTIPELRMVHQEAHNKLKLAGKDHIRAMEQEIRRLKHRVELRYRAPLADGNKIKGEICVQVMERWHHEARVEEMTGKQPMGTARDFTAESGAVPR